MAKKGRKIERINLCNFLSLPTVRAKEFFYSNKKKALEFAKELTKEFGSFNLRTDNPPGKESDLGNLPFFKGIKPKFLYDLMNKRREDITYIIHENVNDELLLFNAVLYVDVSRTLYGEINRIDKTSNRKAMEISQNLEQITINVSNYYQTDKKVNEALFKIRGDLITKKLFPYMVAEVTTHHDNNRIRYIYWEIIKREKNNF
jgi:hypothetical protein